MTKRDPFKYFHSSPEVIRLAVMMYVRYPLSLRQVEDIAVHREGPGVGRREEPDDPGEEQRRGDVSTEAHLRSSGG